MIRGELVCGGCGPDERIPGPTARMRREPVHKRGPGEGQRAADKAQQRPSGEGMARTAPGKADPVAAEGPEGLGDPPQQGCGVVVRRRAPSGTGKEGRCWSRCSCKAGRSLGHEDWGSAEAGRCGEDPTGRPGQQGIHHHIKSSQSVRIGSSGPEGLPTHKCSQVRAPSALPDGAEGPWSPAWALLSSSRISS